jgi:beta-aspartyl-peptidase (threonine type)
MPRITVHNYPDAIYPTIAMAVHGGAGDINPQTQRQHIAGVRRATQAGRAVLESGGTALDACLAAVCVLEDDTAFNAGLGSLPNQAGVVESDAAAMYEPCDGKGPYFGAVSALPRAKHPSLVAARLAFEPKTHFLTADGAEAYALAKGYEFYTDAELAAGYAWKMQHYKKFITYNPQIHALPISDTVGAAARDCHGYLAAVTSSGGVPYKWVGRVGDSCLPGAGLWADEWSASSSTGFGEYIMRAMPCIKAGNLLGHGRTAGEACRTVISDMGLIGGTGGLILLTKSGDMACAYNTPFMGRGFWRPGFPLQISI